MAIIFLLQLNVANTLRIRTLGNRMLMIVDEFVAINSDTGKRLEEGIDRTIAYAGYALSFASNSNFTLKTAVDAAVSFVKLGEAMTQPSRYCQIRIIEAADGALSAAVLLPMLRQIHNVNPARRIFIHSAAHLIHIINKLFRQQLTRSSHAHNLSVFNCYQTVAVHCCNI